MKRDWSLTEDTFHTLLQALGPEPARAAEQYEQLRRSLTRYFDWRGSTQAERHADETIDRVARKIAECRPDDLYAFALGVARNVARESFRAVRVERAALAELQRLNAGPAPEEHDERRLCFERCLAALPSEKRTLVLAYYRGEKRAKIRSRQALAARAGMPVARLRVQAHRIRESLEQCVARCLSARNKSARHVTE